MANFYYEVYKGIQKLTDTFTFPVLLLLIGGIIVSITLEKNLDFFIKTDDKEKTENEAEQYSKITNAVKNISKKQAEYKNNVFEEHTKEENNVFEV